jgi:hypothetical protein
MTVQNDHDWFMEQIAAALTDGLSAADRERFDDHARQCATCAAALAEAKGADESLSAALAGLRPAADLEDRIVSSLRKQHRFWSLPRPHHPMVIRAAAVAAAAIVVGTVGWYGTTVLSPHTRLVETIDMPATQPAATTGLAYREQHDSYDFGIRNKDLNDRSAINLDIAGVVNRLGARDLPTIPSLSAGRAFDGLETGKINTTAGSDVLVTQSAGPALGSDNKANAGVVYANNVSNAVTEDVPPGGIRNLVAGEGGGGFGGYAAGGIGGGGGGGGGGFGGGGGRAMSKFAAATPADMTPPAATPADNAPPPPTTPAVETNPIATEAPTDRKIIRSGEMSFEVDNFDAADRRLRDIVRECHGYIGGTDSQRLPNGKVHGSVTIRVPPENLDTLVLALRALGDLQDQQITAQDITKEYTDLQSELRAAQAMQERLLEIIRTAKGQVKDLLAAENELGSWREKIEQVTGQINYYNNMVSLSTLTVTLSEKDINQAAVATETETVVASLEADDVSHARDEILKAVDAAKGRIIRSDLNQREAGQFTSTVIATFPADTGAPVLDRLRQLGRVTRLQSSRQQSVAGQPAPQNVKVERHDTVLNLSIYNVAAYTARTADNLTLACDDVESSYHAILDFVTKSDGGHVVNSSLERPSPNSTVGTVTFEVREASADAALAFLRSLGVSLHFSVTQNPQTDAVTDSKRAFYVTLDPLAGVPAQETDEVTILPRDGDLLAAYTALLKLADNADVHARIVDKDLQQANGVFTAAAIAMEVPRAALTEAQAAIDAAGRTVARKATRQPDSPDVVDTKVLIKFSFVNVDALEPRQTLNRDLGAADVSAAYQSILDAARGNGAKVLTAQLQVFTGQNVTGNLTFDVPAGKLTAVQDAVDHAATTIGQSVTRADDNDSTTEAKVRMHLTLTQLDQLSPRRTYSLEIQSSQPESAASTVSDAAQSAGGKVVEHSTSQQPDGSSATHLVLTAPLAKATDITAAARAAGVLLQDQSTEDVQAVAGPAALARFEIQFTSEASVVGDNNGLAAAIKQGLTTSVRGLLWSLQLVVIGLCLIGPFAVVGWIGWRLLKRHKTEPGRVAPESESSGSSHL